MPENEHLVDRIMKRIWKVKGHDIGSKTYGEYRTILSEELNHVIDTLQPVHDVDEYYKEDNEETR